MRSIEKCKFLRLNKRGKSLVMERKPTIGWRCHKSCHKNSEAKKRRKATSNLWAGGKGLKKEKTRA